MRRFQKAVPPSGAAGYVLRWSVKLLLLLTVGLVGSPCGGSEWPVPGQGHGRQRCRRGPRLK